MKLTNLSNSNSDKTLSRRQAIRRTAGAAALAMASVSCVTAQAPQGPAVTRGRINQSVVFWCFNVDGEKWDFETTCQKTRALGGKSVELTGVDDFPMLKKYGLECAISGNGMPGAPFMKGFNNPVYQDEVIERTKKAIDACAEFGFKRVIAFTGYKHRNADDPNSGDMSLDEGAANCVKGLKKIAPYAEKKGVTICLEHLNTRDDSHPMKGHPGYQGDDVDYVASFLREVGSPNVKMLFDVYHVQIMNGDVIRRIEECKDIIGHVHTAGNPGRAELDDQQEINYPPIMRKLLDIGYDGYVGQEFIPTRDPNKGLYEAMKLCDV
ncbi:MAG: hydroxypyruvate isomerase [Candidatus Binatia bacterium]|jgi:hydroxypyruvate isomerase